jgi:hypothetical protein
MSEEELSELRQKLSGLQPAMAAEVMQWVQMARARGVPGAPAPRPPSKVDMAKIRDVLAKGGVDAEQIELVNHAVDVVDKLEAARRAATGASNA